MSISFTAAGTSPPLLRTLARRLNDLLWRAEPTPVSDHAYRLGMMAHDEERPCEAPNGTPAWQDAWRLGWRVAELGDETW